ncbi:MAG: hypothetical protein K0M66_12140 [Thiobacillus sp.]|nr:hypothetical protein [Thiobacillus sp.]
MKATQVNIVVDVRQALSPQSGDALVSELGGLPGVSRAWVSPRTSRLLLVDFDAHQTDTQHILRTVVHRGFDARLVGM